MTRRTPALGRLVIGAVVCWHLVQLAAGWAEQRRSPHGRDFASYYYATRVLLEDGDPYDKPSLEASAALDGRPGRVPPYFYPPPFLLTTQWTAPLSLASAYHAWFWVCEALLLGLLGVLAWWWRRLDAYAVPLLMAAVLLPSAATLNALMGQMNLLVMGLAFVGVWRAERGQEGLGGALLGTACVLKMSPALLVLWWMLERRWRPVGWAALTGAAWLGASVAAFGTELHVRFFLDVLPQFSSGAYNSLDVPIDELLNLSPASLLHGLLPPAEGAAGLSTLARLFATGVSLGAVGYCAYQFRRPADADDGLGRAARVAAVAALTLLVPVYTYEHHLVWAFPALAIATLGVKRGALSGGWAVGVGAAWAVFLLHISVVFWAHQTLDETVGPVGAAVVAELKLAALVVVWLGCVRMGRVRAT